MGISGGKIEGNETVEQATVRELAEELSANVTLREFIPATTINDEKTVIQFYPVTRERT